MSSRSRSAFAAVCFLVVAFAEPHGVAQSIGEEKAIPSHLDDGAEYTTKLKSLLAHGRKLFVANWTDQDGGGRPNTKGTGATLSDTNAPLTFPRNMNRISAPDANSCAGCHNLPFPGGGGDFVANVFVLGQRFDFATFDSTDATPTKGAVDESSNPVELQTIANSRNTLGMFGSGYVEMLARQITTDLQALRDGLAAGASVALVSKGIDFGTLARDGGGNWDTSGVEGLPAPSLASSGPGSPPSLIVRPFHQAGAVISLRQFTNNAMNHHHGIQTIERFGSGDPDGDGHAGEMTRADVTACTIWQAALPPPGRVIPRDDAIEEAVKLGEDKFVEVGCVECHVPELPLVDAGWVFSEPNPFNPSGNLQLADVGGVPLEVNLNDAKHLPGPRLKSEKGVTWVPCFTDFKLHDITSGPADPNREALDMHQAPGTPGFVAGNAMFLTRKLWGCANEPPYFHHGQYSTLRQAIEAHAGDASTVMLAYAALSPAEQDAIVEFLKTLCVVTPGKKHLITDQNGRKRKWRAFPYDRAQHLPE